MNIFKHGKAILSAAIVPLLLSGATFADSHSETSVRAEPEKPLQLRKIMQEMGENMQQIVDGISREDWALVAERAPLVANHAKPPMKEKMKILAFAGSDMARFKDFDKQNHSIASALAKAAEANDGAVVISDFARLQESCLACHQAFRTPIQEHFYGKEWAAK